MIFLLMKGDTWRAHDDVIYEYVKGFWAEKPLLELQEPTILTACEGLFIRLA